MHDVLNVASVLLQQFIIEIMLLPSRSGTKMYRDIRLFSFPYVHAAYLAKFVLLSNWKRFF